MGHVVVFGGYGIFGGHVARELSRLGMSVTIAGRDGERAAAFARSLGSAHCGIAADVTKPHSCRDALVGATVAVHCAGPFRGSETCLLQACLDAGCHYVDIADDRPYVAKVRKLGERFAAKGLAAVFGCSSLPGISGALAIAAGATRPIHARVTLFIGNKNPKGHAAVTSLVGGLGRPFPATQGLLRGFHDREVVPLPPPFGCRAVFNFESPDYDLLPALIGVNSVTVKVGFELRLATYALAALARLPIQYGDLTARILGVPGRLFGSIGSSGGAVIVELFDAGGAVRRAAIVARQGGQRMAALPGVYAVQSLAAGSPFRGAGTAIDLLGADAILQRLAADGFELHLPTEPRM